MANDYNWMVLKITPMEQRNAWFVTGKNPQSSMPKEHDIG